MPSRVALREYQVVFRRVRRTDEFLPVQHFTVIVSGGDAESAHRQARHHEALLHGEFIITEIQLVERSQ